MFDANTGNLLRTFLNPTPGRIDAFRSSFEVGAIGDRILIGASQEIVSGYPNAGVVYLF